MSFAELLQDRHLIAILRDTDAANALHLAHAVWDSGIGIVEVPIQTPQAIETLREVAAVAAERGEPVGAGTVVNPTLVAVAIDAGAAFTSAPGLDPDVLAESETAGLPHLPGVATATEVHHALALGADWVQLFPAGPLGPAWLRAIRKPFPQATVIATGGIDATNAADFLRAGAAALGVGRAVMGPGGLARIATAIHPLG